MTNFLNRLTLMLACLALAVYLTDSVNIVIPTFVVLLLSLAIQLINKPYITIAIYILFLICCCFSPLILFLLPVISYELFGEKYQIFFFLVCIPMLIQLQNLKGIQYLLIITLCILSYILKYNITTLKEYQNNYIKLRDETAGMADLLEKKNKDLLEKQDYEVNLATLNERNRIAREIHDNVGHMLSRSILQVGALMAITKDDMLKEALSNVKDSLTDGMDSIRNSIHNIHDESIDLKTKLDALVHEFKFCSVYLDYSIVNDFTTKEKYSILYIVKEALNNVIKHSNATRVTISIMEHPSLYQIVITDNGTCKKEAASSNSGSMGLNSMRERIESISGTFHISQDNGFQIFISIPKGEKNTNENTTD